MLDQIRSVAKVARAHARSVDVRALFPHEAFGALRADGLMAAGLPRDCGGLGWTTSELAQACAELASGCASTGLIYAMHQVQALSVARHSTSSPFLQALMKQISQEQWLLASATSEVGIDGDIRSSIAALECTGNEVSLQKNCSTISYGQYAQAIVATARRNGKAPRSDQGVLIVKAADYVLEQTGPWDTLGFRGTCSPPYMLTARTSIDHIVPEPFRVISSQTMQPCSHILWSAVWLGIAADAVAVASRHVRKAATKFPDRTPFGVGRLVQAHAELETMTALIMDAAREYDRLNAEALQHGHSTSLAYAMRINDLKISTSTLVASICTECLRVCGLSGYSNASATSLGRHVRDALGAAVMISNDRLLATNRELLLVREEDEEPA